jgi:hypothetical protein
MLTTILPPSTRLASIELEALSLEIFATTYGVDWNQADELAEEHLPELLTYAQAWDCAAARDGNPNAECPF